jgi:ATP-dependent Clp protease ATP-binding subunit ClpC
MIRIDMSEFQTPDSLHRLIGGSDETSESISLINEIRKNPFSVLLLDEFEKANPNVWDLFLQLFEDARLTDMSGNTADFRHAIIIMTSNLGSAIPTEKGIGFVNVQRDFDIDSIHKSLYNTFKPEFINRIDRVIVFKPLSKTTMRHILKNELNKVLQRRGFRKKQWAVEWDESAIEFLLEKGFSPHLGARPIKRAIEQYLLAPLAMTIVTNQFPEGDQFLFIKRSHNSLVADFIDPDAPDVDWKERKQLIDAQSEKVKNLSLKKIAFDPKGNLAEIEFLNNQFEKLRERTESEEWRNRKDLLLVQMNEPDFWASNNRKKHLSEIEYRDRFEQSASTLESIIERFLELRKKHSSFPVEIIKQVAERILLMELSIEAFETDIPQDAVIRISYEPQNKKVLNEEGTDFWKKLTQMYLQWAKNRKADYKIIRQNIYAESCEFVMVIEGFAAYQVLEKEKGIHVWEETQQKNKLERINVRVDVRPFPEQIAAKETLEDIVKKIFDSPAANLTKITRKYRHKPSPLISDNVSHWRSGRLDKILGGDFDLIE